MKQIRKIFTQTKFLETTLKRNGGMSHRLHIEHSVGQGLLAFLSQSWHCLNPREGAKFIQMKFHGTCLVKQTDKDKVCTKTSGTPKAWCGYNQTNLCACLFK